MVQPSVTVQDIAHLHAAGRAHMDLKPDNVCMQLKDGVYHTYVLDLGSCVEQDTGAPSAILCCNCCY